MAKSTRILNKERFLRKVKALPAAYFAAIMQANRQSADEMADHARAFVPVRTGKLRDSIAVTPPGGRTPGYSQGAGRQVPENAYGVSAGNSATRYAHLVEFGTKAHEAGGLFKGAANPGTKPRPFFWPAFRLIRKRHRAKLRREIGRAVKRIAGVP